MLLVLFTMAFVLGPALFLALVRYDIRRLPLALIASVLVIASFVLRSEASLTLGIDPVPVFLSILSIWLAWILVLVVVTRAVRAAYPGAAARRWSRSIGAMGTTVPWFGFAAAQMMVK
ncbi:hypothetical protein ACERZ8_04945 [Tateyamaria armeniaca]|uniref:Uncharacterized protein n=1 Tax=Tateyamaria armeniaca TaxID=2518930 RepID=A0ABW8UT76_9RHOB